MSSIESYPQTVALVTFMYHHNPSYLFEVCRPYPQFKQGIRKIPHNPLEGCHMVARALIESPLSIRHKLYIRALERGFKA